MAANGKRTPTSDLVVSRGPGDLGIDPYNCAPKPTLVIIVSTISLYPAEALQQGIRWSPRAFRRIPTSSVWTRASSP